MKRVLFAGLSLLVLAAFIVLSTAITSSLFPASATSKTPAELDGTESIAEPVTESPPETITESDTQPTPKPIMQSGTESAEDLLRKVDALYRASTSEARIRMQIVTPNWDRTLEMQVWSEGMENTFIRILAPKKDRGVATLKLEAEMWNYFPKIDKVIKVPPSMMMSSWMGSDFTNDDLVKEASLADDYVVTREDEDGRIALTLTPKEQTVTVWAKIEVVVDAETLLPLEQSYYNERGEKVRVMQFLETKDFGGRELPSKLEMVPLNKEGYKTVIYYDDLQLDVTLDEDIFTWRNLKSRFK